MLWKAKCEQEPRAVPAAGVNPIFCRDWGWLAQSLLGWDCPPQSVLYRFCRLRIRKFASFHLVCDPAPLSALLSRILGDFGET